MPLQDVYATIKDYFLDNQVKATVNDPASVKFIGPCELLGRIYDRMFIDVYFDDIMMKGILGIIRWQNLDWKR